MSAQRFGDIVDPALRRLGVHRGVREVQLREAFAEIIGPEPAPLCAAVSLQRGALTIATSHGALAQQLQLDSPRLIARLNESVGADSVRRLRFVPGPAR